jgi:hypothetical protein
MRFRIKSGFWFLGLIIAGNARGQNLSPLSGPMVLVTHYMPVFEYKVETGSNAVPLGFASRFAVGGYVNPDKMAAYHEGLNDNNRLGAYQRMSIQLVPFVGLQKYSTVNKQKVSVYYSSETLSGARFTKDAFGLMMRGNTPFLDQEVKVGDNEIWSLSQRKLKLGFWSEKSSFHWNIALSQVVNYSHVRTKDLSLFSDSRGDSISFDGKISSQNTNYQPRGTGWGMQFGVSKSFNLNRAFGKMWFVYASLQDFGFVSIHNVKTISRGVLFDQNSLKPVDWTETNRVNLKAVNLNYSDLRAGDWIDRQRDSIEAKLNFNEINQRGTILSPFEIRVGLGTHEKRVLNKKWTQNGYFAYLTYRHILGYVPRFEMGTKFTKGLIMLAPTISVGGFDVFDVNMTLGFKAFLELQLYGMESFIAPSKWHGGGLMLRFRYPFKGS